MTDHKKTLDSIRNILHQWWQDPRECRDRISNLLTASGEPAADSGPEPTVRTPNRMGMREILLRSQLLIVRQLYENASPIGLPTHQGDDDLNAELQRMTGEQEHQ